MNKKSFLQKIIRNPQNVRFVKFTQIVEAFGFKLDRINASHHIYQHPGVRELVNLQKVGGQTKPYQIRQFLKIVEKYNLKMEDD